jgi:hypothetical protein
MYKLLTIEIIFPFAHRRPWQLRGTPKMLYTARKVRSLFKEEKCEQLPSLSEDVVWKMLYTSDPKVNFHVRTMADEDNRSKTDPFHRMCLAKAWGAKHQSLNDFLVAHDGDHTLVSFECDFHIFQKLKHRDPDPTLETYKLLQACIRHMNLDALWSHSSPTVRGHRDSIKRGLKFSKLAGLSGPYIQDGLLPNHDHCGDEIAI